MDNVLLLRNLVAETIRKAVSQTAANLATPDEITTIVNLCLIGIHRTGKEDPREMMRSLSGPVVEYLVTNIENFKGHPGLARIGQFFIIDWCYRNDYLVEDWKWIWINHDEGEVKFLPKLPLEAIPLPQPERRPGSQKP